VQSFASSWAVIGPETLNLVLAKFPAFWPGAAGSLCLAGAREQLGVLLKLPVPAIILWKKDDFFFLRKIGVLQYDVILTLIGVHLPS
jgi:hypothetical protein